MAKFTSLPPVARISVASYQFLYEKLTQYKGFSASGGFLPYFASSSAASSRASGCFLNASHSAGQLAGNAPVEGCLSHSSWHDTERSPRMLSISSAFSCPALGTPIRIPNCCLTFASEMVGSIRPRSSGRPSYLSRSGSTLSTATVCVGNFTRDPVRILPRACSMGSPSFVTSTVQAPL